MHVDVLNTVVIDRPVGDVSQYAADPDNAPQWYETSRLSSGTQRVRCKSGLEPISSRAFRGRRLACTYEVVELVPGRRLTMRTPGPRFPMETTYTWDDEHGATRMALRNRGTPSGFSAWLAPLMSLMVGRANRKDLALLKRRLEGNIR
jgi:uncharacterized protein YndB with AHSA1/START domain